MGYCMAIDESHICMSLECAGRTLRHDEHLLFSYLAFLATGSPSSVTGAGRFSVFTVTTEAIRLLKKHPKCVC